MHPSKPILKLIEAEETNAMNELGIVVVTRDNYIQIWNKACDFAEKKVRKEGLLETANLIGKCKQKEKE